MVEITTETATAVIEDLQDRNRELAKLVNELRYRLAQRIVNTENKFKENMKRFDVIEKQVLQIFRDYPERYFSYKDIEQEARIRLPFCSMENVGRRVRQLFADKFLWRDRDPDTGKTRYCLKLEEE